MRCRGNRNESDRVSDGRTKRERYELKAAGAEQNQKQNYGVEEALKRRRDKYRVVISRSSACEEFGKRL